MRKALCLFISAILIFLISCENFMNGSNASDELDQMIDEANAKACTLIVSQDTTMGSFLSSGDKTCKVGYSIEVQFTVKKELYVYRGLKAVSKSDPNIDLSTYVQFTEIDGNDSRGVYKTQVKLLKASDDILIVPDCTFVVNALKDECRPDFYEGGREQDSTIAIVFNQSVTPGDYFVPTITDAYGQSLSQYFEEPYFSNDYKTLYIPTVKGDENLLIKKNESTATKDIFVRIDLSQLKDEYGNPGSGTFQHKYRVNKTQDSNRPVITEANLFSTKDTESKYYKALPSKDYTLWTSPQDYSTYHVGGKVYVEFKGSDVGSGISGLYVKETVCKYSDGTSGNESVTNNGRATWNETKEAWCIEYNMRTAFDGIIKLEMYAQDFAENISDSKFTFYVLKDSTVETNNIYFDSEYQELTPDGISDPMSSTESQQAAEQNLIEYFKNMSVDRNGNQTVAFKLSGNSKDVYYESLSTDYDVEVYWGYSEDSIDTKAAKGTDGKFTFTRNVDKLVFINTVCTDQVGNTRTILKRMLPRLELGEETLEMDGRTTTNLIIKDLDSLVTLSGVSQESMTPTNICYLIQYNTKYTVNGNEKTFSQSAIYAGMGEQILNSEGDDLSSRFISMCMQTINLPDDILGANQTGSVKIYAMPNFGAFPVPCSTSSVDYTVTKIVKNEGTSGTGRIGQFSIPNGQDNFNIYGSGPTLSNMNVSSGNSTPPQTMGTGVFGPINPNAKISLVPILNSGLCKIVIKDYEAEGYDGHNIAYTFTPVSFDTSNNSFNYKKPSTASAKPEIYIQAAPYTFCGIHIEAHDKTDNKKYVPIQLPELNANYSTVQEARNVCASGIVLDLEQDVLPPNILDSAVGLFHSSGSYRINNIIDGEDNLVMEENGKTKITYYLIPNSNKSSPVAVNYTLNELKNYSAFKKSLYYKPNVNSVGGDPYIDFPYGNTKEGFYTLVITAQDKVGNTSKVCVPVLNTIKGELIENIKQHWIRNQIPCDNQTYKYYVWRLSFDTRGHDEIYRLDQPSASSGYSINAYLQQISYNEGNSTYSWGQTDEIFMEQCATEMTDESGKKYYDVSLDVGSNDLPWVRLKSYYGFNGSGNQSLVDKGFYYTEYLYTGINDAKCFSKNCMEGLNGLQVMSDRPVFAHTMYCPDKLTETTKVANAARIWESKGVETGIAVLNKSINEPATNYFNWDAPDPANNHAVGSETYGEDYLTMVPSGSWYTTIFHFADGTVVMTDIKQR